MVLFESEVCRFLGIPSIPKREWDKKSSFKNGVAMVRLIDDTLACAVCTFDSELDSEPRVTKTFHSVPFTEIHSIYVVPDYMDLGTKEMDLDEESAAAAERLAQEARELSNEKESEKELNEMSQLPEWIFDEVHNFEEAQAFLRNYNARNKIKGRIPSNAETLKMRLLNIYYSQKEK